jgi:hypothetical protein
LIPVSDVDNFMVRFLRQSFSPWAFVIGCIPAVWMLFAGGGNTLAGVEHR